MSRLGVGAAAALSAQPKPETDNLSTQQQQRMQTHTAARQDAGLHQQTKTVLALLFSVSPVYFLLQSQAVQWGLDKLHIGLIQVLLLLLLRGALKLDPRRLLTKSEVKTARAISAPPSTTSSATLVDEADHPQSLAGTSTAVKAKAALPRRRAPRAAPPLNALYPPELLDATVSHFIALVAPSLLHLIPSSSPSSPSSPLIALSSWTQLYATDSLTVSQHPTLQALYAIEAHFPSVPLKALYETLSDMDRRGTWDGMCEGAERVDEFEVGGRRGNTIWMGMKGFGAFIKRKDMVLLSVVGRLPPIPAFQEEGEDGVGSRSPTPTNSEDSVASSRASIDFAARDTLRLFCATRSFDHPAKPPTSAYNRMQTSSGFVIEDDGAGGSRILQLTDLSGLGSWVPNAVLKMVTQTMIPKSLAKLSEAAAEWARRTPQDEDDQEWLPPPLGSWGGPLDEVSSDAEAGEEEEYEAEEEKEDAVKAVDEAPLSASASKDLHSLVSQLKSLTARLGALEARGGGTAAGIGEGWGEALMKMLRKEGLAVGGATAMAVAAVVLYRKGRRAGR